MICSIVSLCLYAALVFISTSHVSLVLVFDFQHIGHIFFNCIGFHHKHFGHITIRFGCLVLQPHWPHKFLIQSYFSKTFLFQTKTDFIPSVWGDMVTSVSSRWRKGCLQRWPASKGRMRLAPLYMDEGGDSLLVIDP